MAENKTPKNKAILLSSDESIAILLSSTYVLINKTANFLYRMRDFYQREENCTKEKIQNDIACLIELIVGKHAV